MPRTTRAALRNAILEDPEVAAEVPLPSTPQKGDRAPLGEIQLNEEAPKIELEVNLSKPQKKAPAKKGRGPGRKKKAANKENVQPEVDMEVIEDDYESSSSSAVEEACQDLRDRSKDANFRAPYLDRRPQTPPSKAVRAARRKLSPKPATPRFNPDVHKAPESTVKINTAEDSFVAAIESRTPAKIANAEPLLEELQEEDMGEPLVAEDTLTPERVTEISPGKSPRIEDSVEAIDALEEEIEKAGESLASVKEDGSLPMGDLKTSAKAPTNARATSTKKDAPKPRANTSKPLAEKKVTAKKTPTTTKPTVNRPSASTRTSKPAVTKAPTSRKPPQPVPSKPTKLTPSKDVSKPPKRVSSVTNPPFIPAKSTKAPTRSTFTLPGEVVSAKLKAQREERLKREEEEKKSRREFKARPAPSGRTSSGGSAVLPRQTASSRARESLAKGEKIGEATVLPKRPSTAAKPRVSSTGAVVGAKSPSPTKPAPTSAKRSSAAPRTSLTANPRSRPVNPSPNKAAAAGSIRGKPALMSAKAEHDKAVKDKLEAAKKARVEAAERGRAASREWAEKKRREMEARKASAASKSSGESSANGREVKAVVV